MIGHEKIRGDLRKLADAGNLLHGYIFFGSAMVGKKLVARGLAGYLENGLFAETALLSDCMVIEPNEKGSIGIDAAREVKNFLWQKPNVSSRRTVIMNEAELAYDRSAERVAQDHGRAAGVVAHYFSDVRPGKHFAHDSFAVAEHSFRDGTRSGDRGMAYGVRSQESGIRRRHEADKNKGDRVRKKSFWKAGARDKVIE